MEPQGPAQGPPSTPPAQSPDQQDEYAHASQSTAEYIHNLEPVRAQKKKRKIKGLIFIAVLCLGLIGAGVYFFVLRKSPTTPSSHTNQQTATQQQSTESVDDELSEHIVSQDLLLAIDHPKTWQKNDATQGQLILESPIAQITLANGTKSSGKAVITIVSAGSVVPKFTGTLGKAQADSQKIAYTQPSQSQRKETYLSFAGFGDSTGVDAVYITGDAGYKKDQDVPKTDIARSEPIIGVSFVKCDGGTCQEGTAIEPTAWASDKILQVAESILKSLVVQ